MPNSYALIADRDVVAAHVFLSTVREIGIGAAMVRDGTIALGMLFERGAPAILICDLALPGVGGFDLIEGLRRSVPESRTPVIAISADRDLRDRATELRARLGISAILARAASEESVRRVVRRLLGVEEASRRTGPRPPEAHEPEAPVPPPTRTASARSRVGRV